MSRLGGWRRRSRVRWASGPARRRWSRQPGPARDAKAQNTLMRTMTHTTQITRPPTIPVIRSPVRLTRSVPRGARASRGPARSPDKAAVAGCLARWWSSLGAPPSATPSATGSGRPTAVTPSVVSDVPVSGVAQRRMRAEGHAFRGEGLVRRLLDDLVPQRVGGIEGVASGVCSERDANPS